MTIAGLQAQNKVCGTVTNANDGNPLPGVTILVKGTTTGVVTDMDGKYCIEVSSLDDVLVFNFIGCLTEEVKVDNRTEINVQLTEDITGLEEVVAIGYSTQKTTSVLGAVSSVSGVHIRGTSRPKRNRHSKRSTQTTNPTTAPITTIGTESYAAVEENGFKHAQLEPLSTFSIDVDRASYSNVRRFLNNGQKPPKDAIRVEEMINYFQYDYPEQAENEHPLSIYTELTSCPWNEKHLLMQVAMQATKLDEESMPASNLVFLIDVSGSMNSINKLPLVKRSMNMLVDNLRDEDRVAIVVYAGAAGLVLPSTKGSDKEKIRNAINRLNAGGSTAGGAGIKLAYNTAEKHFIRNGNNRVIIATDGDFNVGQSSDASMEELISEKKKSGVFLTCLGYGMGNYKDSKLETLADKGNGNYAYIDNIQEAEKTLVEEFGGTMFTIAKDVKIQIEFNPSHVKAYRLVGYENRLLAAEDFNDDTKDAGEVGAGHTVTALYEVVPSGVESDEIKSVDDLKYSKTRIESSELATVKVRYKLPKEDTSVPFSVTVQNDAMEFNLASENLKFASSVAMFGMLLSESDYLRDTQFDDVISLAKDSRGSDENGYKAEFVRLAKSAQSF